jgi:HAD superfamily hydrolase (TIGR01490 family)
VRAAFFDLDKTVIAKSSLVALGPEFRSRGMLRRRTLAVGVLRHIWFTLFGADDEQLTKIRESVLKVTKGWDHDEVRNIVADTLAKVIEPLIYDEALELIDHHLSEGDEVWLVSMAPAEIVEPFAELLGITGAISSIAEIDEEGKFTGAMHFFAQGANKAVAVSELAEKRDINLSESFAYSDSETDVPMLKIVGHAFAVNPDRQLSKVAHECCWPILRFSTPVRLKDRSRTRTPFIVSALVVGVAAFFGQSRVRRS